MSAHVRSRIGAVGLASAALLMLQSTPASAATPLDEFDAPIFGTSASLVTTVMPTVADVACAHDACTTGVLPSPVIVESSRYFSTTVAPGGLFSNVPGFQSKVIRSWGHYDESDQASLSIMLVDFTVGTDLAAAVASDASARGLTLTGPVQAGDLTTWTATDPANADYAGTQVYVASGARLALGRCQMTPSLASTGACAEQNVAALTTAAATKAVPTTIRVSPKAAALVPSTPKGMSGVIFSQQLSRNLIEVANPVMTSSKVVARQLAGTVSVDLQYGIKAAPGLYVTAQIAPVDSPASRAAVGSPCGASDTWTCTSSKLRGSGRGYVQRLAYADAPKDVVLVTGLWNGSGRWLTVTCNLTNYTPLTAGQVNACSAAVRSLVASSRQG